MEPTSATSPEGTAPPERPARTCGRSVLRFTALTFAIAWVSWGLAAAVCVLAPDGAIPALGNALLGCGTLAPAIAAFIVMPSIVQTRFLCITRGPTPRSPGTNGANTQEDGISDTGFAAFMRFVVGRVRWGWVGWAAFVALLVWRPLMMAASFGFPDSAGAAISNAWHNLIGLFVGGGFEEIGWRACMLPLVFALLGGRGCFGVCGNFQVRGDFGVCEDFGDRGNQAACAAVSRGAHDCGALGKKVLASLGAPLLVGLVWALWHVPLFFIPGTYQYGMSFGWFLGAALTLSLSFGAVYEACGSSIPCILSHAWYNAMLLGPIASVGSVAVALFAVEAVASAAFLVCRACGVPGTRSASDRSSADAGADRRAGC